MIKLFLLIMGLFSCNAVAAIHAILVEKKEPASATCYVETDPLVIAITVDVPYSQVSFLFNDTKVDDKSTMRAYIAFKDKDVKHIIFNDYRMDAKLMKKAFLNKVNKLKEELEKKIE